MRAVGKYHHSSYVVVVVVVVAFASRCEHRIGFRHHVTKRLHREAAPEQRNRRSLAQSPSRCTKAVGLLRSADTFLSRTRLRRERGFRRDQQGTADSKVGRETRLGKSKTPSRPERKRIGGGHPVFQPG